MRLGKMPINARGTDLSAAIKSLSALCQHRDWATDDPLGIGGLLFDACRICQLPGEERFSDVRLLEEVIDACRNGLTAFLVSRHLNLPVSHRLAFRELGLAIGLRALPIIADADQKRQKRDSGAGLRYDGPLNSFCYTDRLSRRSSVLWMSHAQRHDESWQAHQNINDVMLATALMPDMFLSIGER